MIDREELERRALQCVPTEDYYELGDCLDGCTDSDLWEIINKYEEQDDLESGANSGEIVDET